jgi:U4/U6.U5 tri-snRNP-associated protein 1
MRNLGEVIFLDNTDIMEDEHAISVEETNKIRASLGLPLIPVESEKSSNVGGNDNAENTANESISLDETNKIRASLGLKPIPADSSTLSSSASQDEVAAKNWREKYDQEQKIKKEEELRKKLQHAKDKVQRNAKLQGKSLGEDDSYGSTASFLKNLRAKKNKKHTVSVPDEDQEVELKDYTSKDLTGLKVGHKLDDIQDLTQDTVLTLKDSSVLDEEGGDELVSQALVDNEKREENKKNRKGLQKYKGYDDDEFDGKPNSVLSKYDEPDESENFFVLDGSSTIAQRKATSKEDENRETSNNTVPESLDFDGIGIGSTLSSDYQEAKPVKFKKKKSSKKKRKRTEEEEPEEMKPDVEMKDGNEGQEEEEEEDDAQLRAFLTLSRRKAQKSSDRKRFRPEDLAEEIKNDAQKEQTPVAEEGGMVIGDTSDFLSSLAHNARNDSPEPEQNKPTEESEEPKLPEMSTEDVGMQETEPAQQVSEEQDASPLETETASVGGGMANALKLLQSRGVLKKKDEKDLQQEQERRKQKELVDRVQRERLKRDVERRKKREEERLSGKFDGWSQKEREQYAMEQNRAWEIEDAQEMQKIFANYKPNIDIRYSDDMGRELNTKEAYKHLCHQFHGKGPGKAKLEKQLQRMSEEREMEAASIFEADTNKARPTSARLQ